jgi:hypothetical protein
MWCLQTFIQLDIRCKKNVICMITDDNNIHIYILSGCWRQTPSWIMLDQIKKLHDISSEIISDDYQMIIRWLPLMDDYHELPLMTSFVPPMFLQICQFSCSFRFCDFPPGHRDPLNNMELRRPADRKLIPNNQLRSQIRCLLWNTVTVRAEFMETIVLYQSTENTIYTYVND